MNLFSQSTAFQLSNTNSSQSVFEDANGLVGIGTATPLSLLHIHHADVYSNNSSNYFSITQDWQTGVQYARSTKNGSKDFIQTKTHGKSLNQFYEKTFHQ